MVNREVFTYSQKEHLETDIILKYKEKRLRVLALGYKDVKKKDYENILSDENNDLELIEKQFILLCLVVLDDPLRGHDVSLAVSDLKNAGINIKVISSDSLEATKAVSREVGIL